MSGYNKGEKEIKTKIKQLDMAEFLFLSMKLVLQVNQSIMTFLYDLKTYQVSIFFPINLTVFRRSNGAHLCSSTSAQLLNPSQN